MTEATAEPRADGHRRAVPEGEADRNAHAGADQPRPVLPPLPAGFAVWLVMQILEAVGTARHGLTAPEIAAACGLTPMGARRVLTLLDDLCHHHYLWRWDTGRYTLGPAIAERFADFATQHRSQTRTGARLLRRDHKARCLLKYLLAQGVCTCGVRHRQKKAAMTPGEVAGPGNTVAGKPGPGESRLPGSGEVS